LELLKEVLKVVAIANGIAVRLGKGKADVAFTPVAEKGEEVVRLKNESLGNLLHLV
jgi:hypothetical protein